MMDVIETAFSGWLGYPLRFRAVEITIRRLLIAAVVAMLPATTAAMEFKLIGSTLVLSGGVADSDLAGIKDNLDPSRVKLIVLHNNKGGDLWNGLRIGERVRESGVPVTVSGYCNSSCGIIFLGGAKRTYSDGRDLKITTVGFHSAYSRTTQEHASRNNPQMYYYIEKMTGGKFPKDLIEKALAIKKNTDFIYAFHPDYYKAKPRGIMECHVDDDKKRKCTMIDGLDAISVGVITSLEITTLDEKVKVYLKQP